MQCICLKATTTIGGPVLRSGSYCGTNPPPCEFSGWQGTSAGKEVEGICNVGYNLPALCRLGKHQDKFGQTGLSVVGVFQTRTLDDRCHEGVLGDVAKNGMLLVKDVWREMKTNELVKVDCKNFNSKKMWSQAKHPCIFIICCTLGVRVLISLVYW